MNLCHFCRARLGEFLDGTLPGVQREKVAAHLATCPDCAREKRELENTVAALRDLKPVAAPPQLRLKVRSALQQEAQAKRSGRDALGFSWWRPAKMVWAGSLTLAAMLLIVLAKPYEQLPQTLPQSQSSSPLDERLADHVKSSDSTSTISRQVVPTVKTPAKPGGHPKATIVAPRATKNSVATDTIPTRANGGVPLERINPAPIAPPMKSSAAPSLSAKAPQPPLPIMRSAPVTSNPGPSQSSAPSNKTFATPPVTFAVPHEEPMRETDGANLKNSRVSHPAVPASPAQPHFGFGGATGAATVRPQAQNSEITALSDGASAAGDNAAPTIILPGNFEIRIAARDDRKAETEQNLVTNRAAKAAGGFVPAPAPSQSRGSVPDVASAAGATAPMLSSRSTESASGAKPSSDQPTTFKYRFDARRNRDTASTAPAPRSAKASAQENEDQDATKPQEQRYHITVVPPRDVKNAEITLILPPSLRFSPSSPLNSRLLWRGSFEQGKTIEIDFSLIGAKGGEKISLQLEQNGDGAQSKFLEMQTLALPAPN